MMSARASLLPFPSPPPAGIVVILNPEGMRGTHLYLHQEISNRAAAARAPPPREFTRPHFDWPVPTLFVSSRVDHSAAFCIDE
mmetsp:Transcript_22229/g.33007  ORF Transcript_22229/g.33007 Transcript_22229/m.33007 type:complete len:83 (-) Transcript_22229:19-267(-)